MPHDPALAVRMAAFAIATRAKVNSLDDEDVDILRAQAERALPNGSALRRAITNFAVQYELSRREPAALADLGGELSDIISALNVPVPPGQERRDIHG